ncbi:SLATT domain-containing protein [Streptomyces ovatisporus]|uniref:SLATT domain-containing protein n=1 Tax=Streptomyces ovatisporus TaxID=1128682 RepID=A0ABV9ADZ6_9ACTN
MSQPEMRCEGGCRKGRAERADLRDRVFPLGDWNEPAQRLDELYAWVEQRALHLTDSYLADRVRKRRGARFLRAGAALAATASAVVPLLALTGTLPGRAAAWGYLALLGAAVCVGADRCSGLTTSWMRDVATAQAVQRRLETLQYDWAAEAIREVLGPTEGSAGDAADRGLALLRRFTEDVSEIVRAETADWMLGSDAGRSPLRLQWAAARPARSQEACRQPHGSRTAFPRGPRPTMPRQRPPEDLH